MDFFQLIDGAEILSCSGNAGIHGVEYDSRRVKPGFCFLAMRGDSTDGNRYIDKAIELGAVAIVTDSATEIPRPGVAWAICAHGRRALSRLSANFYKHPAEKLAITGVTGTNGKTTTTYILDSLLRHAGRKTAMIGTVEYHIADRVIPAPHTTPEPLELNQIFREALNEGATEAVMEVSSHALAQERVFGIPYDVAVFTNLTRDHLDFHGTMESYFQSKATLFKGCGTEPPRVGIINRDDEWAEKFMKVANKHCDKVYTYGFAAGDFHAENAEMTSTGTRFDLVTPEGRVPIFSPLIGKVNVLNLLAAAAAAMERGIHLDSLAESITHIVRPPGRFERVSAGQPFTVIVDYAHTDDALRNVTKLARDFVQQAGGGRVITLFGCGGDRDKTKRPLMGKAAGEGSDLVVLTSDNPRSEDPQAIINDVLPGLAQTPIKFIVEPDRRKAIGIAVANARLGDVVILAGKGHEKTQTTREGVFPFDDAQVALETLHAAGYTAETEGSHHLHGSHIG
ncbi:UDP-N-acetylmuramoylalanyl-D-glutamate--2,6-diaminopimelate ligase [Candidatus Koribacter versatilis Ellin345]|uniref:UDP-N-acetylmuramoyl-L-alanyl-D-glutamate--2,6-diaminopimelate ligase n=1 Tax=Koribacter versatilis (strain Ellin345) TaxID=204669 RepID=Q1IKG5_KORVE|nr:UDP-N-acetylmuramoyl-L-alanyl-D-glutamate--2,6-diaminopimelate ligase [Candidatus Koribacter versatilis]ABF42635.1 UDP-N-acetylmuramoylalanyl-D-glutamate--2,6-diaminopimelate ligase [Candidatus Koribacter versatilis Ellin345]